MQTNSLGRRWPGWLLLCVLAPIVLSQQARATEPCRIEKNTVLTLGAAAGLLTVPARINGTAVTMGLDTGAQTFVTPQAAIRLKLPKDARRKTVSIGTTATITVENVILRDLEFAGDHFRDKSVASIPFQGGMTFGRLTPAAVNLHGLLGADIMSRYDFELDLAQAKLTLYKMKGCKAVTPEWTGSYSQARFEINAFHKIAIPVEIDGVKLKGILDTGASTSAVTRAAAIRLGLTPAALKSAPEVLVTGVGDIKASLPYHTFETVAAAGLKSGPLKFVVLKSGESDVLLGLDFLRSNRLWISYATRTIFVQPREAPAAPQPVTPQITPALTRQAAQPAGDGYTGASFRDLMDETIETLKLPQGTGAMVARVIPGSPAAEAGLLAGDVLLSINGEAIGGSALWKLGSKYKPGETIMLDVLRNGQRLTKSVTLIDASAGNTIGTLGGGANLIIASEKRIAELFPSTQFPLEWAHAQDNIARAYTENPAGSKDENLEASIPYYEDALSVEAFKRRVAWDKAQINLGLAYQQRKQGSALHNIERAIAAFSAVVSERPKSNPDWGRAQMYLGYAYIDRVAGDKNGNYLLAIASFEAVLAAKSRFVETVKIEDQLGDLYRLLEPQGAENIEKAIAAYKEVLDYKPQGDKPQGDKGWANRPQWGRWAKAAEKMGDCYRLRKVGSPAENAALALKAYGQALTVFTPGTFPEDYARVQALKDEAQAKDAAGISGRPL